jgi:hypothetical protein
MLAGEQPLMTRDWLEAIGDVIQQEHEQNPGDLSWTYEHCMMITRLLSFDTFQFFIDVNSGKIADSEFDIVARSIITRYDNWEMTFPRRLADPKYLIKDFPGHPYDSKDPNDPYKPCPIFGGPNLPTNCFRLGILSARNLFETRLANMRGLPRPEKATKTLINEIFGVINAMRFSEECPSGAFLCMRPIWSLTHFLAPPGVVSERESTWMRDTFAEFEKSGCVSSELALLLYFLTFCRYIWPIVIRQRLEAMWNVDLSKWWFPDVSTAPPVILALREFIDGRVAPLVDDKSEALREMRGIFQSLSLSEPSTPESATTPGSSGGVPSGFSHRGGGSTTIGTDVDAIRELS